MKKLIITILFAIALCGCEEGRLTPPQMQMLAAHVEGLADKVDAYQESTNSIVTALHEHELIGEETVAKVEKISEEIDRVQPQVALIAEAIKNAQYSGGGDLVTIIEALWAANAASATFNPYVVPVGAGLTIVSLIAAFFIERKKAADNKKEAKENELKYKAHKDGVELFKLENSEKAAELYKDIGAHRAALGVK